MIASQLIREKLQPQMGDVLPYVQMFRVLEEIFQNLDDKIHCASCDEVFDLKNFLAFWQVRAVREIDREKQLNFFSIKPNVRPSVRFRLIQPRMDKNLMVRTFFLFRERKREKANLSR